MSRLRNSLMAEIEKVLAQSYYGRGSFSVRYPDGQNDPLCIINFVPLPQFACQLQESFRSNGGTQLQVESSPGGYKTRGRIEIEGAGEFAGTISEWIGRIREDLSAIRPESEINEFAQKLDEELAKHLDSGAEQFSDAEISELTAKLEEMAEKLAELQQRQQITESELKALQAVLNGAKRDLQSYPKAVWYRVTATRLWEGTKKVLASPEGRKVLMLGAKRLLHLDSDGSQ